MKPTVMILVIALAYLNVSLSQEDEETPGALNLTIGHTGVSFGNAPRVNGIRINWSDLWLEEINGINLTLWRPADRVSGDVNGLAVGIVSPAAENLRGVSISPIAIVAGEGMYGVNIAGLALVSQGSAVGMNFGGLGVVGQKSVSGLTFALLGVVSQGDLGGISAAGLGAVAQGDSWGIMAAGLGAVTQGNMSGISFAGLGSVVQGDFRGAAFGGLAVVSQGSISGLSFGGLAVVSEHSVSGVTATLGAIVSKDRISGLSVGGYKIESPEIRGLNLGVGWTESDYMSIITISGYNRTYVKQTGIIVGVFNYTDDLAGIQLGVINWVETNPWPFKVLPVLNVRL
ncbi:MAG TPA: hypothetical protein VGA55_08820 [Bacteroidota bacterium]